MMTDLFTDSALFYTVELAEAELTLYPHFLIQAQADSYFTALMQQVHWQQEIISMYGKRIKVPRLTAWYGDSGKAYEYSGIRHEALPWIEPLSEIKAKLEAIVKVKFNSVLLNLYRDGNDSVAWHSDDEPELGPEPVIASVSLGEPREFQLRHKTDRALKKSLKLPHGSLLIMSGKTQANWEHQIAKSKKISEPRINLTFRLIY